jgi:hypothetical protein
MIQRFRLRIERDSHDELICSRGFSTVIEVSYHAKVNVPQEHMLAHDGPFDRAEWFGLIAQFQDTDTVFIQAAGDGQFAILPLQRSGNRLESMVNWYSFIWRPLFSPGANQLPLITAIADSCRRHARRITLCPLPDEDGSAALVQAAFRAAGWSVFRSACDINHILLVEGRSYADYLVSRPGPLRTTLKRKTKKLETEIFDIFHKDIWEIYQSIYDGSWKPEEGNPEMLRQFAEEEGKARRLRLGIARFNGYPVATQLWTVEGTTAYIHKLAHLEEAQPLSAGSVLTAALMEHVIDQDKVEIVDFGTGDDPYKRDWMDASRPRYMLDCHDSKSPQSWPYILRGHARRVASSFRAG